MRQAKTVSSAALGAILAVTMMLLALLTAPSLAGRQRRSDNGEAAEQLIA